MEQLTEEVAKDVAASPQEWMRFLNTASRLYKYTFPEQLLIYAQRPEATAVASMEIWNQKMYRWIKKGSKGIALIDNTSGPKTKLRYVFDVQDTYKVRNLGKDPQLWNLPVEGEHLVADYLQEQLSLEDTEGGLAESLHQAAKESMQEWLPDALEELRLDVTGTFLEELDEQNQEVEFRELMTKKCLVCITKPVWTGCTGISGCRGFSAYYGLQSAESIRTSGKCSQRDQQTSPDADWTICSE